MSRQTSAVEYSSVNHFHGRKYLWFIDFMYTFLPRRFNAGCYNIMLHFLAPGMGHVYLTWAHSIQLFSKIFYPCTSTCAISSSSRLYIDNKTSRFRAFLKYIQYMDSVSARHLLTQQLQAVLQRLGLSVHPSLWSRRSYFRLFWS